jgi:AGZA family xanthine/uracil permease-like MFS transporter
MAIYAKKPFALAPGMGLNAFFVYTVCLTMGYSWQFALTAVFLEGILFIIMTVTKIRTLLLNAIPGTLKKAIGAGIGLFIAFIGFQNAGIIVNSDSTLVTLGKITQGTALVAMLGLMITSGLVMLKVRGGILIGIILTTLIGLVIKDPATGMAVTQLAHNDAGALQLLSMPHSIDPIFCKFEFGQILSWDMLVVVFTFLFVDMFDTMGTIIGVHQGAGLIPDDGPRDNVPGAEKMFLADSIATVAGACFGTSTTTTYVESAAGVGEGGRTGLTAFSTAVCFALALFFSPIFLSIPSAATAPALIIVGVMMMPSIKRIHWEDYCKSIPAFITIIMMPVAYSISDGILIGVISYVVTHAIAGRFKEISIPMWVLSVLFVLRYIFI